jgi:hypothetical protein
MRIFWRVTILTFRALCATIYLTGKAEETAKGKTKVIAKTGVEGIVKGKAKETAKRKS